MNTIHSIPLEDIKPDPHQPRKQFDEKSIENLSKSLKTEGLIHPIEVDKNLMIIVGELRYRAAKLLGWETIDAKIHEGELPPYERLRRQMAENLQQSGAKGGGQSMNPIDTARAWARLYKLKFGIDYPPGGLSHKETYGKIKPIIEEVGVDYDTVWEYLKLLAQAKYVIEDLLKGRPRTYYREADRAPEQFREPIKKKIAADEYKNREEIIQDVEIIKKIPDPDLVQAALLRQKAKESEGTNRILNRIADLALALEALPFEKVDEKEKKIVSRQLQWLQEKIENYLTVKGEILQEGTHI